MHNAILAKICKKFSIYVLGPIITSKNLHISSRVCTILKKFLKEEKASY